MREQIFIPIEQMMKGVIEGMKAQSAAKIEVIDMIMGVEGLTLIIERNLQENKDEA